MNIPVIFLFIPLSFVHRLLIYGSEISFGHRHLKPGPFTRFTRLSDGDSRNREDLAGEKE
jgi:hypothetical protein